jgi:hypothetical protein
MFADADAQSWLELALPVIRIRQYQKSFTISRRRQIIALYRDHLILMETWETPPVPEAAYRPDGAKALLSLPSIGKPIDLPLGTIDRLEIRRGRTVQSTMAPIRGSKFTGISGRRRFGFAVPAAEEPNLVRALESLLGDRFIVVEAPRETTLAARERCAVLVIASLGVIASGTSGLHAWLGIPIFQQAIEQSVRDTSTFHFVAYLLIAAVLAAFPLAVLLASLPALASGLLGRATRFTRWAQGITLGEFLRYLGYCLFWIGLSLIFVLSAASSR